MNNSQSTTDTIQQQKQKQKIVVAKQLRQRIVDAPPLNGMCYFEIIQIITGSFSLFNPDMLKLKNIIGSELFNQVQQLETKWPDSQLHTNISTKGVFYKTVTMDPDFIINEMETWIKEYEIARKSHQQRIQLLSNWIDKQQKLFSCLSPEIISTFEKKISHHHNPPMTKVDDKDLIILHDNGQISKTKTMGNFYRAEMEMLHPKITARRIFTFPCLSASIGRQYAVIETEELALKLREEMNSLICK